MYEGPGFWLEEEARSQMAIQRTTAVPSAERQLSFVYQVAGLALLGLAVKMVTRRSSNG